MRLHHWDYTEPRRFQGSRKTLPKYLLFTACCQKYFQKKKMGERKEANKHHSNTRLRGSCVHWGKEQLSNCCLSVMQSFSHSEMESQSALGLLAQPAHGHLQRHGWHLLSARTTVCLLRVFRHFQPNAREKNFVWESAAEEAPNLPLHTPLHTAPALGG